MHGVKKVKTTEEKERERKAANRAKIAEYRAHVATIAELSAAERFDDPAGLRASAAALGTGPDSNLLWNYRKRALLFSGGAALDDASRVREELALLEACIRANPKSYWVWHHRRWLLCACRCGNGEPNWRRELGLCDRLLELDARNFHCWNYRRFAAAQAGVDAAAELAFTERKIRQNFSNYSAWHQRSYLLRRTLGDDGPALLARIRETELPLVRNALYVEPADQSGWVYHAWLVGNALRCCCCCCALGDAGDARRELLGSELAECRALCELEPDCKWPLLACTRLLLALGDTASVAEARPMLERLQELDPAHANYYRHLANSGSFDF